jgi:hypothetical protein
MSETLEHRVAGNGHADFDHSVLAELITGRWKQDRPYFTLNERAPGAWLEASWRRQPGRTALKLHWSHHAPCIASADLLPPPRAVFEGAA